MPLSEFPLPGSDVTGDEPPEMRVAPPGPMSRSALARLERRGLVVRIRGHWKRCTQGIALTPRGREVASGLG